MSSSPSEGLQLFVVDSGDGERVLRLEGELDRASSPGLRETLTALEDRPLTVDISGLTFMDSTGLAAFIERRKRQADGAGEMHLRGARGRILSTLTQTGMLSLLAAAELDGTPRAAPDDPEPARDPT